MTHPSNRWVLILGASSGFGAAASKALARAGYNIIGVHLDRKSMMPQVQAVIDECKAAGVEVHYFNKNAADDLNRLEILIEATALMTGKRIDLTAEQITELIPAEVLAKVKEKVPSRALTLADIFAEAKVTYGTFARLSQAILPQIAGALEGSEARVYGVLHSIALGSLNFFIADEAKNQSNRTQIEMTLDIMANSLIYWVQDLYHARLLTRGSKVFAMTSSGSHRVIGGYGPVSAAKAALESHTRQLALELAPHGILVNCFQAGVTDTRSFRMIPGADKLREEVTSRHPGGRMTTPEDVANTFVALMDPKVEWLSGTVIKVDGGEDNI